MSAFTVESSHSVRVEAADDNPITLLNEGDTLYYGQNSGVSADSHDGSLTSGQSITLTIPTWIRSASQSYIQTLRAASGNALNVLERLSTGSDLVPYFTGPDTASTASFTAFGRSLVANASAAAAEDTLGMPVYNTLNHGLEGDDSTEDSTAFSTLLQDVSDDGGGHIHVANHPDGTRGIYLIEGISLTGLSNITISGPGLIKRPGTGSTTTGLIELIDSDKIRVLGLDIDQNGQSDSGSALTFRGVTNAWVVGNHLFNSDVPVDFTGGYGITVFQGSTGDLSENIYLLNNVSEDQGWEVDHGQNIHIRGNTLLRAHETAAIDFSSLTNVTTSAGGVLKRCFITDNIIVDPHSRGINLDFEGNAGDGGAVQGVFIDRNQIYRLDADPDDLSRSDIRIGNSRGVDSGMTWKDLFIRDNYCFRDTSRSDLSGAQIDVSLDSTDDPVDGITVARNYCSANRTNSGIGIEVKTSTNARILDNVVRGTGWGYNFDTAVGSSEIVRNVSNGQTFKGFQVALHSTTNNLVRDNRVIGSPTTPWTVNNATGTGTFVETITNGAGSPEGTVIGTPGARYSDVTNGLQYIKNTGTGNTGWVLQQPVDSTYRTLLPTHGGFSSSAASATTYVLVPALQNQTGPSLSNANGPWLIQIASADLAITGRTTKLRIKATMACGTNPTVVATVGLYPVTASGGNHTPGTVVTGSTFTLDSTTGNNKYVAGTSSTFDVPSDGLYALGYTLSATPAANSGIAARLQVTYA